MCVHTLQQNSEEVQGKKGTCQPRMLISLGEPQGKRESEVAPPSPRAKRKAKSLGSDNLEKGTGTRDSWAQGAMPESSQHLLDQKLSRQQAGPHEAEVP